MLESHPLSFYIPWRGSFTLYERSFLNDRKFLYARPFFPQSFTRKEKEKKESHGWKMMEKSRAFGTRFNFDRSEDRFERSIVSRQLCIDFVSLIDDVLIIFRNWISTLSRIQIRPFVSIELGRGTRNLATIIIPCRPPKISPPPALSGRDVNLAPTTIFYPVSRRQESRPRVTRTAC